MTANIQEEVNHIVELKSRATRLDNLIQGYRLCARTEGKSEKLQCLSAEAEILSTSSIFLVASRTYSGEASIPIYLLSNINDAIAVVPSHVRRSQI